MPGLAQVWLTHAELEALLAACPDLHASVNARLWEGIESKLAGALEGVACPVPPREREEVNP